MNVLGIESRHSYSVLALREGSHRPRLVGDGRRTVIPNAVLAGGGWGSDAIDQWDSTGAASPWLGAGAEEFWRRLHERLIRFLGGVTPSQYGCACVIACTGAASETGAVAALARSAGLEDVSIITPPQAAVARWLAGQTTGDAAARIVSVVTIGDATVDVAAFAVRIGAQPALLDAAHADTIPGAGAGVWVHKLVHDLSAHLPNAALPAQRRLELWQASLEFAEHLRRAAPGALLPWRGPLEERLLTPFHLSADDVLDWPQMITLRQRLQPALDECLRRLGHTQADVTLVSGLGALWPLPLHYARTPVISVDPTGDIALGASAWPMLAREPIPLQESPACFIGESVAQNLQDDPSFMPGPPLPGIDTELSRLLDKELDELEGLKS